MKYFARVAYVGTEFRGFQAQKIGRTVQGELNAATAALFGCECNITGCSRTDSGVHAEDFCLTIEPVAEDAPVIPPAALPRAVLPYLPSDLSLFFACEAPLGFHPRYDAVGKEYCYRLRDGGYPNPFLAGRVWQVPRRISDKGLEQMQAATLHFLGTHDFSAFMCTDSAIKNRVRTIQYLNVAREGDELLLRVCADGFLYNMVRIITGTLFQIGIGARDVNSVAEAIAAKDRTMAGMTAPPDGLYLHKVFYPEAIASLLLG